MDFSRARIERGHSARVLVRVPDVTLVDRPPSVCTRPACRRCSMGRSPNMGKRVSGRIGPPAIRTYLTRSLRTTRGLGTMLTFKFLWSPTSTDHGRMKQRSRTAIGRNGWRYSIFRVQKTIEKRVYRSSDQFIVLSQAFRQQLHDFYGVPADRIHVIPGAVDTMRFVDTPDRLVVRRRLNLPRIALFY